MRFIEKQGSKTLPLVGLVFYLENEAQDISELQFMAQKADRSLYDSSTKFLNKYFEIIIREVEDDILFKPPTKDK